VVAHHRVVVGAGVHATASRSPAGGSPGSGTLEGIGSPPRSSGP
jgi:hypothetical protein